MHGYNKNANIKNTEVDTRCNKQFQEKNMSYNLLSELENINLRWRLKKKKKSKIAFVSDKQKLFHTIE